MKLYQNKWKLLCVFLTLVVILVFIFRHRITEHKVTKAKMDILETLIKDDPQQSKENIKTILDTTFKDLKSDDQKDRK